MKKLIVILVAAAAMLLSAFNASAQDIILTRDSQIITAIISEINHNEVIYKAYDNQSGPTYKIAISQVQKIRFANGIEQNFATMATITTEAPAEPAPAPQQPSYNSGPVANTPIVGHMEHSHGDFELNGRRIYEGEYHNYFNADEYSTINGAVRQRNAGKGLLIAGGVTTGIGILFTIPWWIFCMEGDYDYMAWAFGMTGFTLMGTGITLMTIGSPLYCVGTSRLNWVADNYNQRNAMTFNVVAGRNGLGLALKF